MAMLAMAATGAALGGWAAGAAFGVGAISTGISIGWTIGAFAGGQLFGPDVPDQFGPRLDDLGYKGPASYGNFIPIVYGTGVVDCPVIWTDEKKEHAVTTEVGGGKGGSGPKSTTYYYTCSFAVLICEGEISGVKRIWLNNKLVYDFGEKGTSQEQLRAYIRSKELPITIYYGTEDQEPDSVIEAVEGTGNAPAYRGIAYIVFEDYDLSPTNMHPQVRVEVATPGESIPYIVPVDVYSEGACPSWCNASARMDGCVPWMPKMATTGDGNILVYNTWGGSSTKADFLLYNPSLTEYRRIQLAAQHREEKAYWGNVTASEIEADFSSIPIKEVTAVPYNILAIDPRRAGIHWFGDFTLQIAAMNSEDPDHKVPGTELSNTYASLLGSLGNVTVPLIVKVYDACYPDIGNPYIKVSYGIGYNYLVDYGWISVMEEANPGNHYEDDYEAVRYHQAMAIGALSAFGSGQLIAVSHSNGGGHKNILGYSKAKILLMAYDDNLGVPVWWDASYDAYCHDASPNPDYSCGPWFTCRPIGIPGGGVYIDDTKYIPDYMCIHDNKLLTLVAMQRGYSAGTGVVVYDGSDRDLPILETIDVTQDGTGTPYNYYGGFTVTKEGNLAVLVYDPDGSYGGIEGGKYGWTVRVYDGLSNNILQVPQYTGEGVSVSSIVDDICQRVGLDPSEIDTSALDDTTCYGMVLSGSAPTARQAINYLIQAYRFNLIEADWTLTAVNRGGGAFLTIPEDDLGARELGESMPPTITTERAKEIDLPKSIIFQYLDKDADFKTGAVEAWKVVTSSQRKKQVSLPIAMSASEAKQLVEIWMQAAWGQRFRYRFSTITDYMKVLPADIIEVDGTKMIIDEVTLQLPSIVEVSATSEDPELYNSDATASTTYHREQELAGYTVPEVVFLDMPSPENPTDTAGFYVAVYASNSGFDGATLYRKQQSTELGWTPVATFYSYEMATVGTVIAPPGEGPVDVWDRGNTLTVRIDTYNKTLSSTSRINAINGMNTAVIVSGEHIEILSFQNVTDNGDGTYTLSMLLRGRRGTDKNTGAHFEGSRFVLLDKDTLKFVAVTDDYLNDFVEYRLVPFGMDITETGISSFMARGKNVYSWGATHIEGELDTSTDDFNLTWLYRNRYDPSWKSSRGDIGYADPPQWQIEIYRQLPSEDTAVLLRTEQIYDSGDPSGWTDAPYYTYTAAKQEEDMGGNHISDMDSGTVFTFKIYTYGSYVSNVITKGFPGIYEYTV